MEAIVTRVAQRDIKLATAKRMLVRVMKLLNVETAKLGQFHNPHSKNGKWVWMLVSRGMDMRKKITPIYFSVDQITLETKLSVTRKSREETVRWVLPLPMELNGINPEEVLRELGF